MLVLPLPCKIEVVHILRIISYTVNSCYTASQDHAIYSLERVSSPFSIFCNYFSDSKKSPHRSALCGDYIEIIYFYEFSCVSFFFR